MRVLEYMYSIRLVHAALDHYCTVLHLVSSWSMASEAAEQRHAVMYSFFMLWPPFPQTPSRYRILKAYRTGSTRSGSRFLTYAF